MYVDPDLSLTISSHCTHSYLLVLIVQYLNKLK